MSNEYNKSEQTEQELWDRIERTQNRGKLFGGIIIVIVGLLFLGREMGMAIPGWIFSWQMLLIAIGVFIALKHSFRNFSWIVLILIGGAFLLRDYYPQLRITQYIWPVAIILGGLALIFKPKSKFCKRHVFPKGKYRQKFRAENSGIGESTGEDYIDISAVFGSVVKHVISKDFRGGEVNAVLGGVELNMTQADFEGKVELEINAVFGGARLIIPPHWEVQSELAAVLGSVEDKRPLHKDHSPGQARTLILRGSAVFGGIEIKSY